MCGTEKQKLVVGILGYGVVGQATAKAVQHCRHDLRICDPRMGHTDSFDDVDLLYVCINAVDEGMEDLITLIGDVKRWRKAVPIAVRTTTVPGTMDRLIDLYGESVVHVPEFLREATADCDALAPDKLIIGGRLQRSSKGLANVTARLVEQSLNRVVDPNTVKLVRPLESELAKVALNSIGLIKVAFANDLFDLCEAYGVDYDQLLAVFRLDANVNARHLIAVQESHRQDGTPIKRGAGGTCLPKDSRFLLKVMREKRTPSGVLHAAICRNDQLIGSTDPLPQPIRRGGESGC